MNLVLKDIISVSLVLFSVIDILGSIPIIISMRKKGIKIQSRKASIVACIIMILFLFAGEKLLTLFGVDIQSFAVAGSIVLFLLGIEMILGIHIFKEEPESTSSSIVPIAFPLVAGAGALTTILSLKAQYDNVNIFAGIVINIILVFLVLKFSDLIERKLGSSGAEILRKVFGIILLAIAIKLFKENLIF
ncbi:MarC family protein [Membranihabitans maritimus]|uniref:MarC family protein n=1 Tax=Membranihabitans maritimus TaxID=2904244 RepID=UPI001F2DBF10|nr:MarC family protein [Membranihabitans maritimus]